MTTKLLTIAVPTYNRAGCLERLLGVLDVELQGLDDRVQLIISNNGSTDESGSIIAAHVLRHPDTTLISYPRNLGPDENFAGCVRAATGRYLWMIGDDDLPRRGSVKLLLDLLTDQAPDLLYLASAWSPEIADSQQQDHLSGIDWSRLDALSFARRINVWFTFISASIVNLSVLREKLGTAALLQHQKTNMIQLGWVLPALQLGEKFINVRSVCVLATSNNTGGYKVMEVFGAKFPAVSRAVLGPESPLAAALIKGALLTFLPGLAWDARFRQIGDFPAETISPAIQAELSSHAGYWLFFAPIMKLPKLLAAPVYVVYRIARRMLFHNYRSDARH